MRERRGRNGGEDVGEREVRLILLVARHRSPWAYVTRLTSGLRYAGATVAAWVRPAASQIGAQFVRVHLNDPRDSA